MLLCTFSLTCRHSYVPASHSYMFRKSNGSATVHVRIHTAMHRAARPCAGGHGFDVDVWIQAVCDNLCGRTYVYSVLFTSTYTLAMLLMNLHTLTRLIFYFHSSHRTAMPACKGGDRRHTWKAGEWCARDQR